jgi:hypothetical protein
VQRHSNPVEHAVPSPIRRAMLKTASLSLLFVLTLGIFIAAYAGLPG